MRHAASHTTQTKPNQTKYKNTPTHHPSNVEYQHARRARRWMDGQPEDTMTDGANLGINAERALATILGGEPTPAEAEQQTPEQVAARVAAATPDDYAGATDCLTRAVLRLFEAKPPARQWPTGRQYQWLRPDGTPLTEEEAKAQWAKGCGLVDEETGVRWAAVEGPDLFEEAKRVATADELKAFDGCTGFMWGFAVNQARWLVGEQPGSNLAILTVEVGRDA